MQREEKYEPIVLNLSRTQEVKKHPKHYLALFLASFALLSVFSAMAAWYVIQRPWESPRPQPTPKPPVPQVTAAVEPTPAPTSLPEPTAAVTQPPAAVTRPPAATPVVKGWLTLASYPDNAEVRINENVLGVTPLNKYELAPGSYSVTFAYNGQTSSQTLTIQAGQTTEYTFRFPGFGSLKIVTTRSGCDIEVNGKPAGVSPTLVEGLTAGEYAIVAKKTGYHTVEKTVTLGQGERQEVLLTIRQLGSKNSSSDTIVDPTRPLHPSERQQQ